MKVEDTFVENGRMSGQLILGRFELSTSEEKSRSETVRFRVGLVACTDWIFWYLRLDC